MAVNACSPNALHRAYATLLPTNRLLGLSAA